MSIAFAIAIYFVIWWVLLFAVLPWGVRTSEEVGEDTNTGFADSAPYKPRLISECHRDDNRIRDRLRRMSMRSWSTT